MLNDNGLPVLTTKDNGEVTVIGGMYSETLDSNGFVMFFDSKSNKSILEQFVNGEQISKKDTKSGYWYTDVEMLDDYIVASGYWLETLDFFDYKGKYIESINLASYLYNKTDNDLIINVTDIEYKKGKLSFGYLACDPMPKSKNCKVGVALLQKPYKVDVKSDGHGKITVSKTVEYGDEVVTFTVTPDEGYELGVVKVTDALGNVVYFTENTFTMPYADVVIEATFVPINPETYAGAFIIGAGVVLVLSLTIAIINVKKARDLL
jgi:hypothetical protein